MPRSTGMSVTSVLCLVPMVAHSGVSAETFLNTGHYARKAKLTAQIVERRLREKPYHTMDAVCQCSLPNWMRNRHINVSLKYYFDSAWAFWINVDQNLHSGV